MDCTQNLEHPNNKDRTRRGHSADSDKKHNIYRTKYKALELKQDDSKTRCETA